MLGICMRQNLEALVMFRAERIPDRAAICGWRGVARGMYRGYDRGYNTYIRGNTLKRKKQSRQREDVTKGPDGL